MSNLCTQAITSAVTTIIGTPLGQTVGQAVGGFGTGNGGAPQALTLQAKLAYVGASATSITAWVQTTIDGTNWIDIACFYFTTAAAAVFVNVSGTKSITTPTTFTDGQLANNTIQEGVLGLSYRVKITSVGTYGSGTQLTIDAQSH